MVTIPGMSGPPILAERAQQIMEEMRRVAPGPAVNVFIGDREFKAASVAGASYSSDVPKYTVDETAMPAFSEVMDTILKKAPVFKVKLFCYTPVTREERERLGDRMDQLNYLRELWHNKTIFTFRCPLGGWTDCVITKLDVQSADDTRTVFEVDVEIQKIVTATFRPEFFQYVIDADGQVVGAADLVGTTPTVTLSKPKPLVGDTKSWWYRFGELMTIPAHKKWPYLKDWLGLE